MKNSGTIGTLIWGAFALLISCHSGNEQHEKLQDFRKYFAALEAHSEDRWNYTADTVKLWFDEKTGQPILQIKGKASAGKWREWDSVMNASVRYDSLWYDKEEEAIRGFFYEDNDFYELIGKSPTKTLRTYWLNQDQKIHEILLYWIPEENTTTARHLGKIAAWARVHDSTEISELYPDGKIVPSKEHAVRWKKLLQKYAAMQNGN